VRDHEYWYRQYLFVSVFHDLVASRRYRYLYFIIKTGQDSQLRRVSFAHQTTGGFSTMTRWKRSTALAALPAVLAFIGLATPNAEAGDVTWNYVGSSLSNYICGNYCGNPTFPDTDSLNLSITFNGPLAPNLINADLSGDIVSWTVDDASGYIDETFSGNSYATAGSCPISSTEACLDSTLNTSTAAIYEPAPGVTYATFSTDANGNIIFSGGAGFEVIVIPDIDQAGANIEAIWPAVTFRQPPIPGYGIQIDFSPAAIFTDSTMPPISSTDAA
jgi:hypothetical protein